MPKLMGWKEERKYFCFERLMFRLQMTVGSSLHCKGADIKFVLHIRICILVGHAEENFYWLSQIQNEAEARKYTCSPRKSM